MTELTIESNLKSLAEKIKSSRQLIRSEEHTKMAYIVPFIALFWQAANQGCLGTRDYSILVSIFIKILKYFGLMLLGAVGVILIFSVILLVFN